MTDIEPDRRVRSAMNEVSWRNHKYTLKKKRFCMHPQAYLVSVLQINSSHRLKEAAYNRAEADKVG